MTDERLDFTAAAYAALDGLPAADRARALCLLALAQQCKRIADAIAAGVVRVEVVASPPPPTT